MIHNDTRQCVPLSSRKSSKYPNGVCCEWRVDPNAMAGLFSRLLMVSRWLDTLCLDRIGLGDEGVETLSRGVASSLALTTLYLEHNGISASGVWVLAQALPLNLVTLSLRDNTEVKDEGAAAFGDGRVAQPVTLYLDATGISDAGADALARMMMMHGPNCRLANLSLRRNRVGDSGATALAAATANAPSLRTLDLSCNEIAVGGVAAFTTAAVRVDLWRNPGVPNDWCDELIL